MDGLMDFFPAHGKPGKLHYCFPSVEARFTHVRIAAEKALQPRCIGLDAGRNMRVITRSPINSHASFGDGP